MIGQLTPYEQFMQQLQQQQAGLKSMPSTPYENQGGTVPGDRLNPQPVPGMTPTPYQTTPQTQLRTAPAQTAQTPAPVALPNSVLGNGKTYTPTDWTQAGFQQAYNQNNANGIAVNPANFARWQNYPASPTINKTVPFLGMNGLATGGVQLGYSPGTTQIGGGSGGGIGGGTGGAGGGTPPYVGPIPGNPGNANPGFTPNSGVLADPNANLPGGSSSNQTFNGVRLTPGLNVPNMGQVNSQVVQNFNTLMAQNPSKAFSYLLAQPGGEQILQAQWQPQWDQSSTGADLYHQIIENHTLGSTSSQYDPTAQYYGVDPSTLSRSAQASLANGQAYMARQAKGKGNG